MILLIGSYCLQNTSTTAKNSGANFSHDLSKSCSTCDHLLASYKHIKLAKPPHIYSIFTVLYNRVTSWFVMFVLSTNKHVEC